MPSAVGWCSRCGPCALAVGLAACQGCAPVEQGGRQQAGAQRLEGPVRPAPVPGGEAEAATTGPAPSPVPGTRAGGKRSSPVIEGAPQPAERRRRAPPRPVAKVRTREAVRGQDRFYDPQGPAYALLQKAREALAGFPLDPEGQVDWVRALAQGMIRPRSTLAGAGAMRVLDRDIIMARTRQMPPVRFSHRVHTQWLACSNCHEALFVSQQGANRITMADIFRGRYCGVCHDKVAFSTFVCERCHSVSGSGGQAR